MWRLSRSSRWALNITISVLIWERQRQTWFKRQKRRKWNIKKSRERPEDAILLALKMEKMTMRQGMQLQKLGKAKNGFVPRTSQGSQAPPTSWMLISLWPPELKGVGISHQLAGDLLQQPQETNTTGYQIFWVCTASGIHGLACLFLSLPLRVLIQKTLSSWTFGYMIIGRNLSPPCHRFLQ